MYTSSVEYADTGIARNLQGIAKVLTANLGTRVFYTQQVRLLIPTPARPTCIPSS